MYSNCVPAKQLAAWIAAALIPVVIQLSVDDWLTTAITVTVCLGTVMVVWKWGRIPKHPVYAGLVYLYIIILISWMLPVASRCWKGDNDPAVPLILLGLGLWSAQKGASAAARAGCVLFWAQMVLYFLLLGVGAVDVKHFWYRPEIEGVNWKMCVLLLIPAGTLMLRKGERRIPHQLLLPGAGLLAASLIVSGVLSPDLMGKMEDPFYTMCRTLEIAGVAQHFEAVLSAGMTAGWFVFVTLLLSVAGSCTERFRPEAGRAGVWLAAVVSAGGVLCKLHIPSWIPAILAAVFWVFLPLITQVIVAVKKS